MIHRINHVAVVVENLQNSLTFWQDALGLKVEKFEDNPGENVTIAFLPIGESEIELLEPTNPDSGIGKYLAKKGAGIHHICLEVPQIEEMMAQLKTHGIEMINDTPKTRDDGTRYAFVHPKSTGGVLVELYEKPGA